jgi:CheY-like chemotaxis protein
MKLKPTILVVEDNRAHLGLTKKVLERSGLSVSIQVARDGNEALQKLGSAGGGKPDLVLLDLNLPRVDGKEVLKVMKSDPRLSAVPVVVVSSSNRQEDQQLASDLGADGYISKASGFEEFSKDLGALKRFLPGSLPGDRPKQS